MSGAIRKEVAVSVNTVEAKNRLNALIAQVLKTRKPILVEKHGDPVAVLMDYESFEEGVGGPKQEGDRQLVDQLSVFQERLRKKYPQGTGDSVEIIRHLRNERNRS